MRTIFFNYPTGTTKVAVTVSDQSIEDLKRDEVIPADSVYVEHDSVIDENSSREDLSLVTLVNLLTFDDMENPTQVQFDLELLEVFMTDNIRHKRSAAFPILDNLQMRALGKGLTDVVAQIETDKQTLRDLPSTLDFSTATDYWSARDLVPDIFIDFEAKYKDALS